MSLVMLAVRIAAVEAVKAAETLVGNNVLDSSLTALDLGTGGRMETDQQCPFISVYTEGGKATGEHGTGLRLRDNGRLDLVFNYGVAAAMAQRDKDTGESALLPELSLPATDRDFETVLDVVDAQLCRALDDPENPWVEVLQGFAPAAHEKTVSRASSGGERMRLAAGQTRFSVSVIADPLPGQAHGPDSVWGRFLALLDQHGMPQKEVFRMALGLDDAVPLNLAHLWGHSAGVAHALGLWPEGQPMEGLAVTGDAS